MILVLAPGQSSPRPSRAWSDAWESKSRIHQHRRAAAAVEFLTEYALAGAANRIRPWLVRAERRFNQVCGGIFAVAGAARPLRSKPIQFASQEWLRPAGNQAQAA
jgi:hypothetical protein